MTNSALLSNNGINQMLNRAFTTSAYSVPSIGGVGTDGTIASANDTSLNNAVPLTRTTINACDDTAGWSVGDDATSVALNTTAGEFKEGTGCLNCLSTFNTGYASFYRTIGGTDLSSQYVGMFFYVTNKTNLGTGSNTVRLILGTGGFAAYNYYDFADTTITAGVWNFLIFNTANYTGQVGGGATLTNIDRIKMTVKITNNWATNTMRMDQWWYSPSANFNMALTVNYPTFDTTNNQAKFRFSLDATQCNNFDLQEFKIRNIDGSPIQLLRSTNSIIYKTSLYEVVYNIIVKGVNA